MNDSNPTSAERISALADGCLQGSAFAQTVTELLSDPYLVQTWQAYHLVGDVLRDQELAPVPSDFVFWEKLENRLRDETPRTALSQENTSVPLSVTPFQTVLPPRNTKDSANAKVFRWKMLASVLGGVLVGVLGVGFWSESTPERVARGAAVGEDLMLRDPRADALMAAHRQIGGHSALQLPSGFLRNATFEEPAR